MNSTIKKTTLFLGACMAFQLGGIPQMLAAPSTSMEVMQQTKRITGTVKDATGMEVIGANVIVKGTTNGVITDLDGKFSLEAAPGSIIEISYIGYMTQEIPVTAQTSDLQITLKEDSQSLDEVVVVGYGVQKKKLVTGATVEVKGDEVAKRNTISPLSALQNQSPGVNIVASSGQPGDGFKVNIRGAGTNGDTAPIYVIDGVAGGDINSLNPADIERIDVLKDAASSAIYGARAANGVILVTTKQGKEGKVQVSYECSKDAGYAYRQRIHGRSRPDQLQRRRIALQLVTIPRRRFTGILSKRFQPGYELAGVTSQQERNNHISLRERDRRFRALQVLYWRRLSVSRRYFRWSG